MDRTKSEYKLTCEMDNQRQACLLSSKAFGPLREQGFSNPRWCIDI